MRVRKANVTPPGFGPMDPDRFACDPGELRKALADPRITLDLMGHERKGEMTMPGPFADIELDAEYSIDPRVR